MNKQKSFFKNTLILMIGKISTQFLSFLLLPLYTSYLSTSDYGIADLISTYVIFLAPLFSLQIENAAFRFLIGYRDNNTKSDKLIKIIYIFVFKIQIVIIILFTILNAVTKIKYYGFIIIYLLLYQLYSLNQQIARGKGKNVDYTISACIYGILTILCNIFLIVRLNMGVKGLLISYIVACFVSLCYLLFKLKIFKIIIHTPLTKNDTAYLKECLKYSAPLIPSSISWWVLNASDRTIISYFISVAANGIYAISNKFSSIFIGLFNIVSLSWTESVALHIKENDGFLEDLYNLIFKLFLIIVTIMIGAIPIVYPYFIGKNFWVSYMYVPILLLGSLFNVCFGLTQGIYVGLKKTATLAKTSIMCALVNIIIDLCLINYIGIYAAAISTCVAYFVLFIYQYIDINKYYKIKLKVKSNIYLLVMLIIGIIIYYINNNYISFTYSSVICVIIFILNFKYLKKFVNIIIRK